MRAFITFNRDMMHLPVVWQLWVLLLVSMNLFVPLLYLDRLEAQVALGTGVVSLALMTGLSARFGFTRIVGLGHIVWVPLLAFLWIRVGATPAHELFGLWMRVLIGVNTVSLVLDAVDVIRYLAGDRAEMVTV